MNGRKQKSCLCICIPFSLMLMLTACSYPHQKIIDDIQTPTVLAFDKGDNDIIGTVVFSDFTKEENNGEGVILEGRGLKTNTIKQKMEAQSSKPIEIGKLNLLIFGSELAEEGVSYFIETICRDPLIGSNMFLAVSEGKAAELLRNGQDKSSKYLYNLIEHNFKDQNVPLPILQRFLFDYYGEGFDATIPYIKINSNNKIEIDGLAVFKSDQLKLTLNMKESFLYKILKGQVIKGEAEFDIKIGKQEGLAVLSVLYGKTKRSISETQMGANVNFQLELQGRIKDYPEWLDLRKNTNKVLMKNELEKQLKEDLEKLVVKFTDNHVDPLGIGDLIRAHSKRWNEKDFYQNEYQNISYDFDVNIELIREGIGE